MARIPYGIFSLPPAEDRETAWFRLNSIREYLEDDEMLPPDLATWLGEAISISNRDSNSFMVNIGLKNRPGKPRLHKIDGWKIWGERIHLSMVKQGWSQTEAIDTLCEYYKKDKEFGGREIKPTKMREWYKTWLNSPYSHIAD